MKNVRMLCPPVTAASFFSRFFGFCFGSLELLQLPIWRGPRPAERSLLSCPRSLTVFVEVLPQLQCKRRSCRSVWLAQAARAPRIVRFPLLRLAVTVTARLSSLVFLLCACVVGRREEGGGGGGGGGGGPLGMNILTLTVLSVR